MNKAEKVVDMKPETKNYFESLNSVDVNGKIEKKNGLSYLSWSYAWGELKKRHPEATYTVHENKDGYPYHTDGKTCWVKTGVTVNGIEHVELLPVMDFKNKSIALKDVTSMDVNKAIQRSLTKAIARHGLGLYVYAGEDLPEENKEASNFSMAYDADQNKQAYDQALKTISGFDTLDKLETYFKTNKNKLNKLPKDLYEDVLAACSQQKTELLTKMNGAH